MIKKTNREDILVFPIHSFILELSRIFQESLEKAVDECSKADLMVVIGSSLVVQPAATLPCYTLKNNGKLVIINNMPTPLDSYSYLKYDSLEEVFNYLNSNLL